MGAAAQGRAMAAAGGVGRRTQCKPSGPRSRQDHPNLTWGGRGKVEGGGEEGGERGGTYGGRDGGREG